MAKFVDNVIAFRILAMLVKNFKDTDAYKLGIIDEKGKALKKTSQLSGTKERDAYTYLHRLVFNMKRIINKLPGGESKLKSLVSALFLVKEYYESDSRTTSLMEDRYNRLMELDLSLIEEEILVDKYLKDIEEMSLPDAKKLLKKSNFELHRSKGPHDIYKHTKTGKTFALPKKHKAKDLSIGVANSLKKTTQEDVSEMEEDAPANATGAMVSTDQPVVNKKDVKKYKDMIKLARR